MLENGSKMKRQETATVSSQMVASTKATVSKAYSMVMVFIHGLLMNKDKNISMLENGSMERCRVKESSFTLMD